MLGLLFWLALPFVIGLTCLPAPGNAASSAYVETTQGLNLNRVQLVILVPPEFTSRLSERATTLFADAGLPLPDSNGPDRQFIATLTLSLNPQPLSDTCPGQVLYVPSLKLTEPVMIPRNSVIMHDVTWLAHTGAQVREPVTVAELERDLDAFIHQFIADYRAANAGFRPSNPDGVPKNSQAGNTASISVATVQNDTRSDAGLKELRIDQLQLSVSAGRYSKPLTTRALQQFINAGQSLSPGHGRNSRLTLGVELIQQPLEDQCPGKVLYESGLYLVEEVQIKRNPLVSIWSDTWLREATQVVAPRSPEQLESDQDALLRQFIDSLKTH
jgi:hypothetical protein